MKGSWNITQTFGKPSGSGKRVIRVIREAVFSTTSIENPSLLSRKSTALLLLSEALSFSEVYCKQPRVDRFHHREPETSLEAVNRVFRKEYGTGFPEAIELWLRLRARQQEIR